MTQSGVIIIELDNLITIAAGAITIDTFRQMLSYLLDPTTHFAKWYRHSTKPRNITAQYEKSSGSLYFDRPLDDIRTDLDNIILGQSKVPQTNFDKIKSFMPVTVAVQNGGGHFANIVTSSKEFIVRSIQYLTNNPDPDNPYITDLLTNVFTTYLQNLHKIEAYSEVTVSNLYYLNCKLALTNLLIYQFDLIQTDKETTHAVRILQILQEAINNIANMMDKSTDESLLTSDKKLETLHGTYRETANEISNLFNSIHQILPKTKRQSLQLKIMELNEPFQQELENMRKIEKQTPVDVSRQTVAISRYCRYWQCVSEENFFDKTSTNRWSKLRYQN